MPQKSIQQSKTPIHQPQDAYSVKKTKCDEIPNRIIQEQKWRDGLIAKAEAAAACKIAEAKAVAAGEIAEAEAVAAREIRSVGRFYKNRIDNLEQARKELVHEMTRYGN